MKLLADLHTHSNNSRFHHGKNSIEEMAIEANEIGLVEIGITDHGYSHFFRTSKAKLKEARKIVDEINGWSKTKVLLGIEADIISEDGQLDIDNETLSMLDILIIGYHKMTFTDFANFFGKTKNTEEAKRKCTNAFVNAINRYPVTIVAHLDSILHTDLYEIGKACSERGTMVEINNRHTKWTEKQVDDLLASECSFVVSSDAHRRESVGEVSRAFDLIRKYNIPSDRIANVKFEESEMSEEDRNYSAYRSVYESLAKQKREKEEEIEKKEETEITGKLSDEMEKALRDIAAEKGMEYKGYKPETVSEGYMKNVSEDDLRLIKEAEDYIRNYKLESIQKENENISAVDGEENLDNYRFKDDHPLIKNNDVFEEKFQPINKLLKGETEINANNDSEENLDQFKSIVSGNSNASAIEQLSNSNFSGTDINNLKEIMAEKTEIKPQSQQNMGFGISRNVSQNDEQVNKPDVAIKSTFKKVEPENFMDSITQTRLVNNAEKAEPQPPAKKIVDRKVQAQKNNRRGAFIVVDNLLDDGKK